MYCFQFSGSCLEIGAQWSIAQKDTASFERYMKQLKSYYLDYTYVYLILKVYALTNLFGKRSIDQTWHFDFQTKITGVRSDVPIAWTEFIIFALTKPCRRISYRARIITD